MTQAQVQLHRKIINANWYVFGVVLLVVGMAAITGHWIWFLLSFPAIWLFGVTSAIVIAGNSIIRRSDDTEEL